MDLRLLERESELGNAEAQSALGTAFLLGEGVPQDAGRAATLFERAAGQGEARAQCNLGAMYAQGIGVPLDYAEATKWYALSAEQGDADGLYNLAVVFAQGLGGSAKDLARAAELCRKAAAKGQQKAKLLLKSLEVSGASAGASQRPAAGNDTTSRARPELMAPSPMAPPPPASAPAPPPVVPCAVAPVPVAEPVAEGADALRDDHRHGQQRQREDQHKQAVNLCSFCSSRSLELPSWRGEEDEARFPKPGVENGSRRLFVLRALATEAEVSSILEVAQMSLEFNVDNDSVDQRPTYERYVVQIGQYLHADLERVLRPIVEERLLPYVREKYNAPDAVVCTVLIRRYLPDERRVHPTHLDGHAFCTAVLGLNVGEFDGGLYVQPDSDGAGQKRQFVDLGRGDLAVHQYDLPHGVRVFSGRRYSIIFWIKDCIQSCLTNDTPWYESAAATGDPDALAALAQKLSRGMGRDGVGSDVHKAAALYRRAADMGHVDAMTNLGVLCEVGTGGLPKDGAEALKWFRKAAGNGDSTALRLLGVAHANGTCGLRVDAGEAVRWLTRAAEGEDLEAMYLLSVIHRQGSPGWPPDPAQASEWLRRAADMGHPEAQYLLGAGHHTGEGAERDLASAALWFRRAAQNGSAAAQCNLGAFRAQGLGGLEVDLREALRWYTLSAERGNADGQHNLALMHARGLGGLPCDAGEARLLAALAAAQGHVEAAELLRGLPIDAQEAPEAPGRYAAGAPEASPGASPEALPEASQATAAQVAARVAEARGLLQELRARNAADAEAGALLEGLLLRLDRLSPSADTPLDSAAAVPRASRAAAWHAEVVD